MVVKKSENKTLEKIASVILAGGVVIMPCDTIYGIVSLTGNTEKRIREIKGRDEGKPFIRLIGSKNEIATFTDLSIDNNILSLWPGPLTLIVPDRSGATVAVRMPEDEYLLSLLDVIKAPIVSTSVNFTGSPFLNNIRDIKIAFEKLVDIIVEDGDMDPSASASTILDITSHPAKILRQGSCIVPENVLK